MFKLANLYKLSQNFLGLGSLDSLFREEMHPPDPPPRVLFKD